MYLGAHVSTSGGMDRAPANGLGLGCEAIQVFTKNQRQWKTRLLTEQEIENYRCEFDKSRIKIAVSHDSYLTNLGSPDEVMLAKSRQAFREEIERCELLSIPFLVFHPGSHLGAGEKAGLRIIADSLNDVLQKTRGRRTQLLLETTAGQGSNLGFTFEQLAEILDAVKDKKRVGICLDTCHIFAAGYEVRSRRKYEATMRHLDEVVGLEKLKAFHLNDSKTELGSRVDRHEHIGQGRLGLEPFRFIVNDERFAGLPMVLETPGEDEDDKRNLATLKRLRKSNGD